MCVLFTSPEWLFRLFSSFVYYCSSWGSVSNFGGSFIAALLPLDELHQLCYSPHGMKVTTVESRLKLPPSGTGFLTVFARKRRRNHATRSSHPGPSGTNRAF